MAVCIPDSRMSCEAALCCYYDRGMPYMMTCNQHNEAVTRSGYLGAVPPPQRATVVAQLCERACRSYNFASLRQTELLFASKRVTNR